MNQRQANASNMYASLLKFLDNNSVIWEGFAPIKQKHGELKATITGLSKKLQVQQGKNAQGLTQDKQAAMETLTGLCFKMALKLKTYAKMKGNRILLNTVDFRESELEKSAEREILSRSRQVLSAAADNLPYLKDYRITEKEVNDLKVAIETAEPKTAERDIISGERSSLTVAISELFAQAQEEVSDLDDLVEALLDEDQEDFVNGYFTIRRINDRRGRKSKKEEQKSEEKAA